MALPCWYFSPGASRLPRHPDKTGTHSIVGNPLFADALGHLSAGSPATDHGIDVGLTTDLDGNPRPSGAGFDIGAYEFQVALLKLFLPLVRR